MSERLTDTESENIRQYLAEMDALGAREPECDDKTTSEAWNSWYAECAALRDKYWDSINRALGISMKRMDIGEFKTLFELLTEALSDDGHLRDDGQASLLARQYAYMLNGTPTNDFMRINKNTAKVDSLTRSATFSVGNGRTFKAKDIDRVTSPLSTSARKILDTAAIYLKNVNYYRGSNITPTVEIPLIEYGERCNISLLPRQMPTEHEQAAENARVEERKREFKDRIRRDLRGISELVWSGEETKGKNKGDYKEMRLISSHRIIRDVIRINFDIDAANFLVNAYPMYFPLALLGHDNRNPSAYAIGRKIAYHNSIDHNSEKGTECTLSVKKLLEAAPEIPDYSALISRGQRNWKDKIKHPLEKALDANISVGYLSRWEYRNPRTGETYSKEDASVLSWNEYCSLMIDFSLVSQPDRQTLRAANEKPKRTHVDSRIEVERVE